jgi:predicted nucleotide-binding protein
MFIVHGHDDNLKLELKNYLQNTLKLGEPVILHEQPSAGKSIIEKFEKYAKRTDIVFVLLTPNDNSFNNSSDNIALRRARQNVIFEMGYFFSKLERSSGKVILLYKSPLELPSDIHGVIYIDVSNGIQSSGESIRKELSEWL